MGKNIIDVDHVSVRFNLANQKVNNLKEYAIKAARHELMFQEFMALKDVSLHVKPGEAWALIGTNGAGKSTLLKVISGILKPYLGTVKVRGKIAPMIELGAGFDMQLTARENIFLNGAVLGHSRQYMEEHFDEIVRFAEIGDFLDLPIMNFSSGMKARLGFAVATMADPDILICDEVLSVGDANFRRKCNNRMEEMLSGGTTLLYVSHNMDPVRELCDHALWLEHGEVIMSGDAESVCSAYERRGAERYRIERRERREKAAAMSLQPSGSYDYLVVGAGLFGSTFAFDASNSGKSCLVIDKREHVGGTCYTKNINGINVHQYGPHIYHTKNKNTWMFLVQFTQFYAYIHSPLASYRGNLYNLPFNMNTFAQLWGESSPEKVRKIIEEQTAAEHITSPRNLEEQALAMYGRDIYERLIKGYSEKMWGHPCRELPADLISDMAFGYTYRNEYFQERYFGIPVGGYTQIFDNMLEGADVQLGTSYKDLMRENRYKFGRIIYTGPIDEYFDYCYGPLEYRTVRLETEKLPTDNYQGVSVIHYTDADVPYTRRIEHKHFEYGQENITIVSKEYEEAWTPDSSLIPAIPVVTEKNIALYQKYRQLAQRETNVIFCGRLGTFRRIGMGQTIEEARRLSKSDPLHRHY